MIFDQWVYVENLKRTPSYLWIMILVALRSVVLTELTFDTIDLELCYVSCIMTVSCSYLSACYLSGRQQVVQENSSKILLVECRRGLLSVLMIKNYLCMNVLMLFATQVTQKKGFVYNRMNPSDRINFSVREASYWFRSNHLFLTIEKISGSRISLNI